MTNGSKILVVVAIGVGTFLFLRQAGRALNAECPANMPQSAQFLQSGFNSANNEAQGNWVACRENPEDRTDWCRVTNESGFVLFEGDYLPIGSTDPLPAAQLRVAQTSPGKLWVRSPTHRIQVPILPLAGGQLLVPAEDAYALAQRWQNDHEEYERLVSTGQ